MSLNEAVAGSITAYHIRSPEELTEYKEVVDSIKLDELRKAIPAHCWKPSYLTSFWYLFRDLALASITMIIAFLYIPHIEHGLVRFTAWAAYGYLEGLIMTGLWVLGHECGHMAFSPSTRLNDSIGFVLHSICLTPYFSWQSSHRRHHIYANNLAKDHNYVPSQRSEYAALFVSERLEDLAEDLPIWTFLRIVIQQLFGFPWYLTANITASDGSLHRPKSSKFLGNSHFLPSSTLFRPEEAKLIFAADVGLGLMLFALWNLAQHIGFGTVALLYFQPYLWVNHWIVAITYLHHTHPKLPKYQPEAWTYLKGATATIDRDFGWIGRFFFHNIIEFHVIHHLFSRIPFYYGEEATEAIVPLLGGAYHVDRENSIFSGIWEAFTKCQYVEPDAAENPKDRAFWYKTGPVPPPEIGMGIKEILTAIGMSLTEAVWRTQSARCR